MKKFYIASSFKNIDSVRYVSKELTKRGYVQTYDWTINERASTFERLKDIGIQEKKRVINSDFIIVLMPAGKGSHIELGIAIGLGKKVFIFSPDNLVNDLETTSTFYHLPEVIKVTGTLDDLIENVTPA